MKAKELEVLRHLVEFEESEAGRQWLATLGWPWHAVKVWPATLNRLVVEDCVEVVFSSNSGTHYRLTEKGRALGQGGEAEAAPPGPEAVELPDDLFQDIVGHDELKELLRAAVLAERPVHVLLAGPPALAKSLFLWELERALAERAHWVLGSAASRAGLVEVLLEERPYLLLIDEVDKLDGGDQAALLSAMEGGRVTRTKVGRMADAGLGVRVVAAANEVRRLSPELLSRFALRRVSPYSQREFREVVRGVLVRREDMEPEVAEEIALRLEGRSQEVRDAVRVARLAPQLGVERAVELLLGGP